MKFQPESEAENIQYYACTPCFQKFLNLNVFKITCTSIKLLIVQPLFMGLFKVNCTAGKALDLGTLSVAVQKDLDRDKVASLHMGV